MCFPAARDATEHRVPLQVTLVLPLGSVSRRFWAMAGLWFKSA